MLKQSKEKHLLSLIQGFTLIELVLVIVLIGIIGVAVLPQWTSSSLSLEFEARRVLNDIRYAQALSMTTGQRYRWVKLSSTSYQLTNESGAAVLLPSGVMQITLPTDMTFGSLTSLPNNLIAFNSEGSPYVTTSLPGTALSATATIPMTMGSQTRSIQVTSQTGYGALQ